MMYIESQHIISDYMAANNSYNIIASSFYYYVFRVYPRNIMLGYKTVITQLPDVIKFILIGIIKTII